MDNISCKCTPVNLPGQFPGIQDERRLQGCLATLCLCNSPENMEGIREAKERMVSEERVPESSSQASDGEPPARKQALQR